MSEVILKEPKFEAMINGKWRKVLSINYHTHRPSIDFYNPPSGKYAASEQWNWPLKGTKIRVVAEARKN